MANPTPTAIAAQSIGSWEELSSVTFDIATLQILLESEEGGVVAIPCDDFAELCRLAKVSFSLAEGHNVELKWNTPVLDA